MLTKAERDEARAFCTDARARWITWNEADRISRIAVKALDDLDAQDAELARIGADKAYLFQANVANEWEERYERQERRIELMNAEIQRLTAENDRLIVIARADEWQARYWAEHDAVADREATIMAERASSAAMRAALESLLSKHPNGHWYSQQPRMAAEEGAALQSEAGKALLNAHAAELAALTKERDGLRHEAPYSAQLMDERDALRQRAEAAEANLIEARKTAEGHREPCYYCGKPINNLAANPGLWSVGLCHGDDPGRLKWHHVSCVSERLAKPEAAETALRQIVSRRTENMTEATYAYCCDLAERALGGEGK